MTINEEKILRKAIRNMVNEAMDEMSFYESDDKGDSSVDRDGKPGKESDLAMGRLKNRRSTVMDMLKNKHIDCAPYAYELWPDKKKDNARSQFYKCRDGEKNDNGNRYSFTDQEVNRLYSLITNNNNG